MVKAIGKNWLSLLLSGLAVAGLVSFAANAVAQEEKVLNIYNWSDYIAPDTIQNFEKETGIKVRYDTYDNNEILHAKLVAGKTGYDIVVPSSTFARLQIDGGLLTKLDVAQLPNLKNLDPDIQAQIANIDPGQPAFGELAVGLHHDWYQYRQGKSCIGYRTHSRQCVGVVL